MKRQGEFINNLSGNLNYKSFNPATLPPNPDIIIDSEILNLLVKAHTILGELDGKSSQLPNKDLYISMYIRKEALLSSQIEGTQATFDDLFDPNISENTNLDVADVVNYIKATNYANKLLNDLPISNRFIKQVHSVLLDGTRGEDKNPGQFRKSQNWIGPHGSTLKNAKFIPPNIDDMEKLINNLENFIHANEDAPNLLKIALIHYQFETIHPFLDGNGRIGRLLISLLLKQYGILKTDTLYISYYFKRNRVEYYDRLMDVRLKGHYEQWIKFFLEGIIETGHNSLKCIDLLVSIHNHNLELINTKIKGSKTTVLKVFKYIQANPIIDIGKTAKQIGKAYNTTSTAIMKLQDLGILKTNDEKARNRIYMYEEYLNVLREGTEL